MNIVYFFFDFEPKILFAPIYAIAEAPIVEIISMLTNSIKIEFAFGIIAKIVASVLGTNTAVPITVNHRIIIESRLVIFVCMAFTPVESTSNTCSAN